MIKKLFPDGSDLSGAAVVTHSSGNHAQAVAKAATQCGIPAHIVMPEATPAVKVAAVRNYGGIITFCQNSEQVYTHCVGASVLHTVVTVLYIQTGVLDKCMLKSIDSTWALGDWP